MKTDKIPTNDAQLPPYLKFTCSHHSFSAERSSPPLPPSSRLKFASALIAALLLGIGSTFAADTTFTGAVNTDWFTAGNWNNGVPTVADKAWVNAANTNQTINLDGANGQALVLNMRASSGYLFTLNVTNSTLTVDTSTNGANPGVFRNSVMNIETNGVVNMFSTGSSDKNVVIDNSVVNINAGGTLNVGANKDERIQFGIGVAYWDSDPHTGTVNVNDGKLNVYHVLSLGSGTAGNLNISGSNALVKGGTVIVGHGTAGTNQSKLTVSGGRLEVGALGYPSGSFDAMYVGLQSHGLVELSDGVISNAGLLNIVSKSTANGITGTIKQTGGAWHQGGDLNIATADNRSGITGKYLLSGGVLAVTNASHSRTITIGGTNSSNTGFIEKTGGTIYADNIVVGQYGHLVSGANQTWSVFANFSNSSTLNTNFDMTGATVSFEGARAHVLNIAGTNFGTNFALGSVDNFAFDAISLDNVADTLTLTNTLGGSRALYINALLLAGSDTNLIASNITSINGLDIYYRLDDPRSSYLGGATYNLKNGGQLIGVIPEPSSFALLVGAILGLGGIWLLRRSRRNINKETAPLVPDSNRFV